MSFQVIFHSCSLDQEQKVRKTIAAFQSNDFELLVKSSGSTGVPKEISHSKKDVIISAERTNSFFQLDSTSKVLCPISFDSIGGKMSLIRALVGDYEIHFTEASRSFTDILTKEMTFDLVSLAPIQLEYFVKNAQERLIHFHQILVGGSSVSSELETQAIKLHSDCYLGFGMTETISHIALRRFGTDSYQLLPDIFVEQNETGTRILDKRMNREIDSTDLIEMIDKQHFSWIGRADIVINSGGVKIHPDQLEKHIENQLQLKTVIVGKSDAEYGEKVVLVSEKSLSESEISSIKSIIETKFGKYAVPKSFIVHSFSYLNGLKLDRKSIKKAIDRL